MAFETFSLLVSITVLLKATGGEVEHCTKGTCTTKPLGFNCNVVYEERVLGAKLPDGALRDLPGTVRGLSLLVSNADPLSDPSLIISWRPPEVALSVYEVYLLTWDNRKPGNASVPFPCMFVVNVTDSSQITKTELRVTSSTFRNSKDITVYVNTWLSDKEICFLRQAKVTFYATDSLQATPAYWNYLLSVALPGNDSLQLRFQPHPNATRHLVQVCQAKRDPLEGTQRQSGYQCSKYRSMRKGTNTGIFQFNKTCATYRIRIIPVPNAYRQMYRVDRFVPALHSPPQDSVALSLLDTSASLTSTSPKVKDKHGVNVIPIVLASLLGLAAAFVVIWMRVIRRRCSCSPPTNACNLPGNYKLLKNPSAHNTDLNTESDVEFWNELKRTTVKNVCLLCSEDCECHIEAVEALSRCLETSFKCRICQINCDKDIDTQLETVHVFLAVNSEDIFTLHGVHRSRLSQVQDSISRNACVLGRMVQRLREAYSDRVVMVRLDHTEDRSVIQSPNNHVYSIPGHMSDLICRVHKLKDLVAKHSLKKWLTTGKDGKDLVSAIEKISQCCGRSRCRVTRNPEVRLFQDSHVVGVQDISGRDRQVVGLHDLLGQTVRFEDSDRQVSDLVELKDFGEQAKNLIVQEELGGKHRVEVRELGGQGTDWTAFQSATEQISGHTLETAQQEGQDADVDPWIPPTTVSVEDTSLEELEENLLLITQNYKHPLNDEVLDA